MKVDPGPTVTVSMLSLSASVLAGRAPESPRSPRAVAMVTWRAVQAGSGALRERDPLGAGRVQAVSCPQAVAFAKPCPHVIRCQQRAASRPPLVCVCVRAGARAHSVLETGRAD